MASGVDGGADVWLGGGARKVNGACISVTPSPAADVALCLASRYCRLAGREARGAWKEKSNRQNEITANQGRSTYSFVPDACVHGGSEIICRESRSLDRSVRIISTKIYIVYMPCYKGEYNTNYI